MKAQQFLELLEKKGFDFFTGVPCSYVKPLIAHLSRRAQAFHVPAVREDIAVGLAAGAYLAGKTPVIYMQNSGLGYSLEAIASLHLIYHFPALFLITYRGPDDPGMEEHLVMGQHTEELLNAFQIKYSLLKETISGTEIQQIKEYLKEKELPYVLLVTKGALA
ncbi:MAG: sulfopyruvate decarboxylase subunit alpha [Candidatus Aminicenantes bacterium]|nr:MAG: sulfopyruvate decarboxylase subunit alpha [Candidatus Aminicenantes bacterium]